MHVVIAIGSNIGDRFAHLQFAVDQLAKQMTLTNVSSVYVTAPVGGPEQDDFYNAVVTAESEKNPQEILNYCHTIEEAAHRVRIERWGPRTLDVDLLAVDNITISSETLTLPHPRAHERGFVLVPWNEIDSEFELVGHGRIKDLVQEVETDGVTRNPDCVLTIPSAQD